MRKPADTTLKAFALTLFLYSSALLAAVWQLDRHTPTEKAPDTRTVPIHLSMYQPADTPPPKPIQPVNPAQPAPVAPIQPIDKPITEPAPVKPIVEPKPEPKPKSEPKPKQEPKPKPEPKPEPKTEPKANAPEAVSPVEPMETAAAPKVVEAPATEEAILAQPPMPTYSAAEMAEAEDRYLSELSRTLAQLAHDSYPRTAKRRHWEGKVVLTFVLYRNGDIKHLEVVEGHRRRVLNQAALGIIAEKLQMRFKPFYDEIERDQWQLTVPVNFSLN
ncbi:MAG: energy transducer TonB [Hydrogenovibrio sp.]